MQKEKLFYPYVPDQYGIDFCGSIAKFEMQGITSGTIRGGSGAELEFWFGANAISVMDPIYPDRGMSANVSDGIASFSLQTRNFPTDSNDGQPDPHPDMFAAQFVRFALDYFESTGEEVHVCEGTWLHPSDNWRVFIVELLKHRDSVKAAKETWTGKLFTALEYSEIERSDIRLKNTGTNLVIKATFHRSQSAGIR